METVALEMEERTGEYGPLFVRCPECGASAPFDGGMFRSPCGWEQDVDAWLREAWAWLNEQEVA